MSDTADEQLIDKATAFAEDLTSRIGRVIPTAMALSAVVVGSDDSPRVIVAAYDNGEEALFPLHIGGTRRLDLFVKLNCCWDRGASFLAVEESWFHVIPVGDKVPLFRYEYLRRANGSIPAAHVHVHAHRDEFAYALVAGEKGKARQRWRAGKPPRMAEFHFPVGGHRFRPCIEDVLNAVVVEFGVDHVDGWEAAVRAGREQWRRTQLRAAVCDAPDEAVAALRGLGYDVKPPDTAVRDDLDRLRAY
ncbi:hypothetical protein [Micromonospora sp. NPDC049301]|uniref:hypothetical protein n=1 Tax=Micromonospora sp. NPDC049301 TaxID=3155723 RepID=UPI0034399863